MIATTKATSVTTAAIWPGRSSPRSGGRGVSRSPAEGQRDADQGDGHVDEEDRPPAQTGDQDTANQRAAGQPGRRPVRPMARDR